MSAEIAQGLARYLAQHAPQAGALKVEVLQRIHGGASRETWRVRVAQAGGDTQGRGLIVRRDPPASLIDTDRAREFAAYRAFAGSAVPVPDALYLETDPQWLGAPFFVMEEVPGCTAASLLAPDPYGPLSAHVGAQFWTILGRIAAHETAGLALGPRPAPEDCWRRELDHWAGVIDADELSPHPIVRGAIRHLRRHAPPPAQRVAVVHGDYRSGNFLVDGEGTIRAILDWEMAHFGDPLEDLAWAMDGLWAHHDPARPGGMVPEAEAIALWEAASGLVADPDALAWWRLFAMVKGLAIWITSAKTFESGQSSDPVLAFPGWYCLTYHDAALARAMAALKGGAA